MALKTEAQATNVYMGGRLVEVTVSNHLFKYLSGGSFLLSIYAEDQKIMCLSLVEGSDAGEDLAL
jgi:hypothetical protein